MSRTGILTGPVAGPLTATVLAAGFTALGAAKVARTPAMTDRAEHVGYTPQSYQLIGAAELAGAAGLLAGLSFRPAGVAAATGLLGLLTGAVIAHARHGGGPAELAPAAAFATGTVVYLTSLRGRQ